MNIKLNLPLILFVSFLGLANGSQAASLPTKEASDSRIQKIVYDSNDVVRINTITGVALRVVFSKSETIKDVAASFSDGWSFSNLDNILYIKAKSVGSANDVGDIMPIPAKWDTNLMVTTNRRLYDFDLRLLGSEKDSAPTAAAAKSLPFRIEFQYPLDVAAAKEAVRQQKIADEAAAVVAKKMSAIPEMKNWDYTMRVGAVSRDIAPISARDDGRFTYIQFKPHQPIPSIYVVDANNQESLLNFHIDKRLPDTVILHQKAGRFNIRLDNMIVQIYNERINDDYEYLPLSGTSKPNLVRKTREGGE